MIDKVTNDVRVYTDVQSLSELRAQKNSESAKHEVAKQFESMFLQLMLRSMRDANKAFATDLFGSDQMDMYQDIYDKQLALTLSSKGTGLAEMIEKNLELQQKGKIVTPPVSGQKNEITFLRPIVATPIDTPAQAAKTNLPVEPPAVVNKAPEKAPIEKKSFTGPEEFIKQLWPMAKFAASIIGTSPQILLAQAALETNWGKNILKKNDTTSSNNLFNIKADHAWTKPTTTMETLEQKNGVLVKERSSFRVYDSFMSSFTDYVNFLRHNTRYSEALKNVSNPAQFVHELQNAGYATDTNYAEKVLRIFSSKAFKNMTAELE